MTIDVITTHVTMKQEMMVSIMPIPLDPNKISPKYKIGMFTINIVLLFRLFVNEDAGIPRCIFFYI